MTQKQVRQRHEWKTLYAHLSPIERQVVARVYDAKVPRGVVPAISVLGAHRMGLGASTTDAANALRRLEKWGFLRGVVGAGGLHFAAVDDPLVRQVVTGREGVA